MDENRLLLIGDKKTPPIESIQNLTYLSVESQLGSGYSIVDKLPFNHYARKNIGYLEALKQGAQYIFDTDDDNIPYEFWGFPEMKYIGDTVTGIDFFNIYLRYTDENLWPRGFPLNRIKSKNAGAKIKEEHLNIGVWQGLADIDPDVDAIYRLTDYQEINFHRGEPLGLAKGVYCPFNSQNTLWARQMIPYAYLPSTVTFRFTDILRGYITQRCLWAHDRHLGFTEASVYQERNDHDLMKDFESEIPCYIQVEQVCRILNGLNLSDDYSNNLRVVYAALSEAGIVAGEELQLVEAWLDDLAQVL